MQAVLLFVFELLDELPDHSLSVFPLIGVLDLGKQFVGEGEDSEEVEHTADSVRIFEDIVQERIFLSDLKLEGDNYFAVFDNLIGQFEQSTEGEVALVNSILRKKRIIGKLHGALKDSVVL